MVSLSKELGIAPHGRYSEDTPNFDLVSGQFQSSKGEHGLSAELSQLLYLFMLMEREQEHLQVDAQLRRSLLDAMIAYFQIHLMKHREFKSLDVLKEVMQAWHNL